MCALVRNAPLWGPQNMRACPGPVGAALQGDRVFAAVIEVGVWRRVHPGLASILNPTTGVLMRDMGGGRQWDDAASRSGKRQEGPPREPPGQCGPARLDL